jgi:hypothetical protein
MNERVCTSCISINKLFPLSPAGDGVTDDHAKWGSNIYRVTQNVLLKGRCLAHAKIRGKVLKGCSDADSQDCSNEAW